MTEQGEKRIIELLEQIVVLLTQTTASDQIAENEELTTANAYMVRIKEDGEPMLLFYVHDHPARKVCVGKLYAENFGILPFQVDMTHKHWTGRQTPERADIPPGYLIELPYTVEYVRTTREAKDGKGMDSKPITRITRVLKDGQPIAWTPVGTVKMTEAEGAVAVAGNAMALYRQAVEKVLNPGNKTQLAMDVLATIWSTSKHKSDERVPAVEQAKDLPMFALEQLGQGILKNPDWAKTQWAKYQPKGK